MESSTSKETWEPGGPEEPGKQPDTRGRVWQVPHSRISVACSGISKPDESFFRPVFSRPHNFSRHPAINVRVVLTMPVFFQKDRSFELASRPQPCIIGRTLCCVPLQSRCDTSLQSASARPLPSPNPQEKERSLM